MALAITSSFKAKARTSNRDCPHIIRGLILFVHRSLDVSVTQRPGTYFYLAGRGCRLGLWDFMTLYSTFILKLNNNPTGQQKHQQVHQ